VFGSKAKMMPVDQSPAVSTTDVMSATVGTGATTAFVTEKAGTSTAPPTKGEQDDLFMSDSRPMPDPQMAEARGARAEDDAHRCLYVGTPWEEEVTADQRDVFEFNEASRMIGHMLSVRVLVWVLQILTLGVASCKVLY
jgi:hypothetical protein